MEKNQGTRELPSALVRAVVAPWDLAVSKFPAILDRYSRFSDARVFDFSFFLFRQNIKDLLAVDERN